MYVTHHSATTAQPPLIGLLSMNDPTLAMKEFVDERGHDSAPPPSSPGTSNHPNPLKLMLISGLSSLVGWIIGAVGMSIFRTRRAKKNKQIKL